MQGHAGTQSHHQQRVYLQMEAGKHLADRCTPPCRLVLGDKKHKLPTPRDDTHPQTITEARCLTEHFRQAALCLLYFCHQTRGPLLP